MSQYNVQLQDGNGSLAGLRNQLINGDFRIWQRGASAYVGGTNPSYGSADRWCVNGSEAQLAQATAAPDGFIYSATQAVTANGIRQRIELVDNKLGPFYNGSVWTLSFWSTLTDTSYLIRIGTGNVTSVVIVPKTSITATGETSNGFNRYEVTFTMVGASNGEEYLELVIYNDGSTQGNFTGVQLEPGPLATPFEHRPVATELALCQRYYQTGGADVYLMGPQVWSGTGDVALSRQYNQLRGVVMRTTPTEALTKVVGAAGTNLISQSSATQMRIVTDATVASGEDVRFKYDSADAEL